jgi:hypothetical protein
MVAQVRVARVERVTDVEEVVKNVVYQVGHVIMDIIVL